MIFLDRMHVLDSETFEKLAVSNRVRGRRKSRGAPHPDRFWVRREFAEEGRFIGHVGMDILQSRIEQCAPAMSTALMAALVRRESDGNPFAIGMDGKDRFLPQPRSLEEAIAAAETLARTGKRFSVGLAQIHISNIRSFGMTWTQAFDACVSLRRGQQVFESFQARAIMAGFRGTDAVFAALRGYNSGSVFAAGSNAYASAIMADAAKMAMARVGQEKRPATAAEGGMPATSEGGQAESAELFDK